MTGFLLADPRHLYMQAMVTEQTGYVGVDLSMQCIPFLLQASLKLNISAYDVYNWFIMFKSLIFSS